MMDVGLIQRKSIGTVIDSDQNKIPKLFTPLTIRGQTFPNRIWHEELLKVRCITGSIGLWVTATGDLLSNSSKSRQCACTSCEKQDGVLTDFHLAHIGNLALRGPGLVFIEATSVEPQGRLSPQDSGIWGDEHVEPIRRIARLVHASGGRLGIQLAHGGRKSGNYPPYHKYEEGGGKLARGVPVPDNEGGFADQLRAPSSIPWSNGMISPKELPITEINKIVGKFADGAKRAVDAGVDVIEIHGAHGYLIHGFLSGSTNKRTDEYGGSFENRSRFVLEIITAIRSVIPKDMPLFLRVSGTDWSNPKDILFPDPNGWDIQQVIELCRRAVPLGIDLIDVSSGGNIPGNFGGYSSEFGFQLPLAEQVKKANIEGLIVGTVGGMNDAKLSEQVLQDGKADVTLVAREFIKDPSYVYTAARDLGIIARWANQYSWMWPTKIVNKK